MEQYPSDYRNVGEKLKEVGDKITPDMVDDIIGNKSWTRVPSCAECGKNTSAVILLGEEIDYESEYAHICKKCLKKAAAI